MTYECQIRLDVSLQAIVTCDTVRLKFKILCDRTPRCFQSDLISTRKRYDFDQLDEFCISQASADTLFRFGVQKHHLCLISSGFCLPKIIKIAQFFTNVFKK